MKINIGKLGEIGAKFYLISKGYFIWDTNWKLPNKYELDIVCRKGSELVFVEVKTRRLSSSSESGHAELNFDNIKKAKIEVLISSYIVSEKLRIKRQKVKKIRVDLITLELYPPFKSRKRNSKLDGLQLSLLGLELRHFKDV